MWFSVVVAVMVRWSQCACVGCCINVFDVRLGVNASELLVSYNGYFNDVRLGITRQHRASSRYDHMSHLLSPPKSTLDVYADGATYSEWRQRVR